MDCCCSTWIFFGLVSLGLVYLMKKKRKAIAAFFIAYLADMGNRQLGGHKEKLFEPLNKLAKEKRKVKVLELGGGSGCNFTFIKSPVQWTVTEPNSCFESYFKKNVAEKGGDHEIDDLKIAAGEDLSAFEPNSYDAVIATLVLCNVDDIKKTLQEIKTVLKPGGKFYFLDHVRAADGTIVGWFQDRLTESGIWPGMADGCRLNRKAGQAVKEAGFASVDCTNLVLPNIFHPPILKYMDYGTATK